MYCRDHFSPHCLQLLQLLTAFSTLVSVVQSLWMSCLSIPGRQSQTKRQRKERREPCNPTKPMTHLSVCRGFAISATHNPGFPGRLAPGKGVLVLCFSTVARLAEQDELWDHKLTPGQSCAWSAYSSKAGVMTDLHLSKACIEKQSISPAMKYLFVLRTVLVKKVIHIV